MFPLRSSLLFCVQIEEEERARIQQIKDEECEKAMKELEAWKEKQKVAEEEEGAEEARRRQQDAAQQEAKQIHHHRNRETVLTPGWNLNAAKGKKQTHLVHWILIGHKPMIHF